MTSGDWSLAELRRLATYFAVPESVLLAGPQGMFRREVAESYRPVIERYLGDSSPVPALVAA